MILFTGKDFKDTLQKYINSQVTSHLHESIQLYGNLSTLKTETNVAKNSRKNTCIIENSVELPPPFVEESATWNEWLNSETLNLIAVVGQSGAGKSNLAKMILQSQIMSTFQYKFYISLNKFDCEKKINILEFLTQGKLPLGWVENRQIYDNASKYDKMIFKLFYGRVCIVFDEIGIGSFSFDKNAKTPTYYSDGLPKQFFSSVLNGELLFEAKVVIVLHHWEYDHVTLQLQPETWKLVHVFGINHTDQTRMAEGTLCRNKRCCAYNETQKNAAILEVGLYSEFHDADECLLCKNHDLCDCANEIQLLLNVPIHCQSFLEHCSSCTKGCRIANACYLLLKWIKHISNIYPIKSFSLTKVGEFAWTKYFHNTFLFELEDLTNLSRVEKNIFFVGLCNIPTEMGLIYRFSNILVQDFLAALWCLSLSNDEIKRKKHQFSQWKNSAIVIGFMSEISQMHRQFRFDPPLKVNAKNVSKIQRYSSRANMKANLNPQRVSDLLRRCKENFTFS